MRPSAAAVRGVCAAGALAIWIASGGRARAQAQPEGDGESVIARLDYQVPAGAGCMDGAALARAVEAQLERRVFDEAGAEVVVVGAARRTEDGWVAELALRRMDGTAIGTRELRTPAAECAALDE